MQENIPMSNSTRIAAWDFLHGLTNWRLWAYLGLNDIRQRYRRSSFGPLWLALGLGATILGIGILYSQILKSDPAVFIPYLSISLLIWNFISSIINESTTLFVAGAGLITSTRIPYTSFALRCLIRNLIVAAHCVIPVIIAFAFFHYAIHPVAFLSLIGLLILIANMYWISLLVGISCLRFRDIGQMVIYMMQIALFVTPIIWLPSQVRPGSIFMQYNPFFHLLNIVREPIFHGTVPVQSLIISLAMLAFGSLLTALVLARFRRFLVFWI